MQETLVNIIAAAIIIIAIAAVVAVPVVIKAFRVLKGRLEDARNLNEDLQRENSFNRASISFLKAFNKRLKAELADAVEWNAELLQEIEVRKAQPLGGLTDDQLVEAVRKEVEGRVSGKFLSWYACGETADGEPFWKLASKVGGAAFRVVDKAKRGKLTVQA